MARTDLLERINGFERWHYEFDLDGVKTPVADPDLANRHAQRVAYFFDPMVAMFGGSLAGKRVLDLGCNAGFWSLQAVRAGCDHVLGVDGRQMHIDQANLVFEVNGIDRSRYAFRCDDFFKAVADDIGHFDVVLCLGIFYHISKHVTLLEALDRISGDVLVIDTYLSMRKGSALEIRWEDRAVPTDSFDHEIVMIPTRQGVLDMVGQFGYRAVTLKPSFSDYAGAHDYRRGKRRAFMCAKTSDLSRLPAEVETDADARTSWRHWLRG